jgi:hypothetical protein
MFWPNYALDPDGNHVTSHHRTDFSTAKHPSEAFPLKLLCVFVNIKNPTATGGMSFSGCAHRQGDADTAFFRLSTGRNPFSCRASDPSLHLVIHLCCGTIDSSALSLSPCPDRAFGSKH